MAGSSSLEDYNLLNCGFIVCDDIKTGNVGHLLETTENADGLKETPTLYIQQGQYIVPVNSNVLLEETVTNLDERIVKIEAEDESVQEDVNQSEQTIIYCTPEQFAEYSQILCKNEETDATSIFVNSVEADNTDNSKVDMDDVQIIPLQDSSELDESNDSEAATEFQPYEELIQQPHYQYAVLKNGKLHLQTLNIEDDQKSYLKKQIAALQASINFDNALKNSESVDINKITGKNLLTGQTVTLDKYMKKLISDASTFGMVTQTQTQSKIQHNVINKKVVIGKTLSGKKLIGKIVRVQKGKTSNSPDDKTAEAATFSRIEANQYDNDYLNSVSPAAIIDTVSNTLAGLMNLQFIHQKLYNNDLIVKLIRNEYDCKTEMFVKNVYLIKGYMENVEDRWYFSSVKVDECKNCRSDESASIHEDASQLSNEESQMETVIKDIDTLESTQKMNNTKKVYLTLIITVNKYGKTTTKVHFGSKFSNTEKKLSAFDVETCNKLFECEECRKQFGDEVSLFHHNKVHHNQRWHLCTICSKSFNTSGSLKRHLTVHNPSLRPLECTICLQRFTDQSNLKKHLLIHTGVRAFICEVCGRSFVNQGDLNFHSRIHDPVKQFLCDVCGRGFSRQSNLMRHAEIHRGESALFQCHICGCTYSFPSSLTRHIVHKHIGNFNEKKS